MHRVRGSVSLLVSLITIVILAAIAGLAHHIAQ